MSHLEYKAMVEEEEKWVNAHLEEQRVSETLTFWEKVKRLFR